MLLLILAVLTWNAVAIRILPKSLFGGTVTVPVNGPCVLNNDDKFKCTEKGYYEMVQCDEESCFCVDTHNGVVAHGSRTSNKRTTPQCSACHSYLKAAYINGEPPKGTFIPRCDRDKGNYEPLQCDAKREYCYCVDPKSGKEIDGTRKIKEGNTILRCDDKGLSVTPAKPNSDGQVLPVGREYCKLDRDPGHTCDEERPKVMYYFDASTFDCLAFEYKGCGGNDNRYYTKSDCGSTCVLPDFFACSGLSSPARQSNGAVITCGGVMPDAPRPRGGAGFQADGCPSNYKCVMGAFFGFCCDKAMEEKFLEAYRPKCPRGRPLATRRDGYDDVLLGKSCDDHFCPQGYTCKQGEIFAHCCT